MVKSIMRQIVDYGSIERGVFGVTIQNLNPELAQAVGVSSSRGALIAEVAPNSSAERSGLLAGDVVISINDQRINNGGDLRTQLGLMRVGEYFALEIFRNGNTRMLRAKIEDPYASFVSGKQIANDLDGSKLGEVLDKSHLGENPGIAVARVKTDSPAWQVGLRDGDVVFQANRRRVQSLDELKAVAAQGIWQLKLRRGKSLVTLVSR